MDSDDDVIGRSHRDTSLEMRHQQTGEVLWVSLAGGPSSPALCVGFYRCGSARRRSDWLKADRWVVQSSQPCLFMKSLRETLLLISVISLDKSEVQTKVLNSTTVLQQ